MYKIITRPSGFIIQYEGFISLEEMQKVYEESIILLKNPPKDFGVIVDISKMHPLFPEAQDLLVECQELFKKAGMRRSAVITPNAIIKMQFIRLAKESGVYTTEKYFDGTKKDVINKAILWVKDNVYLDTDD